MMLVGCMCLVVVATNVFSQQPINGVLVSSSVNLRKNIKSLSEEIDGYEQKIIKCQNTISNAENIQKKAQDSNNKEAYRISSEAIANSRQSISECRNFIAILSEKKKKYEASLNTVMKAMESNSSLAGSTNAVALHYQGDVSVMKQDGNRYNLSSSRTSCLEAGDIISTSDDGFVVLDYLQGRGSLTLGPGTEVKMSTAMDSTDILDVMKGKIYSGVLKADEYEKKMADVYESFNRDPLFKTLQVAFGEDAAFLARLKHKFEVRTPAAVCAVRGTEFTIEVESEGGISLYVIEGKVEVKPADGKSSVFVTGGQVFSSLGRGSGISVTQADTLNTKKWWNYEQ